MRISDSLVLKLLANSKQVSKDQVEALKKHEAADKKALQYLAVKEGLVTEKELTQLYAEEIDIPFVDLDPTSIDPKLLELLPRRIAKKYKAVVFNINDGGIYELAMVDPEDVKSVIYLRKLLGNRLKIYIATELKIQRALARMKTDKGPLSKVSGGVKEKQEVSQATVAETLNKLVDRGIRAGATDIHIEPRPDTIAVRYRIDGVLTEYHRLPLRILNALLDQIKLIGGLSNGEVKLPQSGKFRYEDGDQTRTIVIGTMPVLDGEKVVMRIINESSEAPSFRDLGFWGQSLKQLNKLIAKPEGLILVSGPIGCGRSTTLFSILSKLYSPTISVSTIEDPIEHRLAGVNQSAVNPINGVSFATGLKAILEHDPNIILVGELRDIETAELVVRAAQRGHLVLSSIFTPNAASAVKRLSDMAVGPHQTAASLNGVISQRLVRRLCESCAVPITLNRSQLKQLKEDFNLGNGFKTIHKLEKVAMAEGIGSSQAKTYGSSDFTINRLWQASEDGCRDCDYTGHKGRIGLYEVLINDEEITKLISAEKVAADIEKAAISNGMIKMKVDGFIKALRGLTSIDEVLRVTSTT